MKKLLSAILLLLVVLMVNCASTQTSTDTGEDPKYKEGEIQGQEEDPKYKE